MLVVLLFLFAANGFVSTGANDEAEVIEYGTAVISVEDLPSGTSPIEPNTDVVPPEYSTPSRKNDTITCGSGEILVDCPSYCPSDFCPTGDGQNQRCPQPDPCPPPACKCRFNYRRAQNGQCIPTRNCPAFECNKPNEEYNSCPLYCPTDSCSQATPTGECPSPGGTLIVLECRPTCRCKKGFWRLDNGTCVPYLQCPGKLTCGPNEVVDDCPVDCKSDYCPTSDEPEQSCPKPCQCPPPACKCGFNYRRAANGTCIPTRQCPPYKCEDRNAVFNPCPPLCPTDDCSQATPDSICPVKTGRIGIVLPCQPKCRCKKNYWKKDGKCVPYNACPGKLKCPPGDIVDECPLFCNTDYCPKNEKDKRSCAIPFICPKPACKCPFNYLRAANGTCIPASSCPPVKCSGPHEVFNSCPPLCPTDDCKDATPNGVCPRTGRIDPVVECRPGCRCEKNYWRKNGTCVPYEQCSKEI